ncbi:hypothetical protein NE237_011658 [Protea cynaroides]|uniref:Uncharacterized protein n=1 Tax=Protea cynaroides TaxID=273540 RepID=A0A9Q0JY59_9MAGN|nr:hypothetical protein NE237_011658 [Protea cynaroides]
MLVFYLGNFAASTFCAVAGCSRNAVVEAHLAHCQDFSQLPKSGRFDEGGKTPDHPTKGDEGVTNEFDGKESVESEDRSSRLAVSWSKKLFENPSDASKVEMSLSYVTPSVVEGEMELIGKCSSELMEDEIRTLDTALGGTGNPIVAVFARSMQQWRKVSGNAHPTKASLEGGKETPSARAVEMPSKPLVAAAEDCAHADSEKLWFAHSGDTLCSRTLIYTKRTMPRRTVWNHYKGWNQRCRQRRREKFWFARSGDTSSSRTLIYTKRAMPRRTVWNLQGMESKVQAKKKG